MDTGDDGVARFVDQCGFTQGVAAPEDECFAVCFATDLRDDGIGELFPAETAVTAGGVGIDRENAVQQQYAGACPVFQGTGFWDLAVEIGGVLFKNVPQ